MDLDIEMDVDDVQEVQPVPEAYTYDIITGEEQVRASDNYSSIHGRHLLTYYNSRNPAKLTMTVPSTEKGENPNWIKQSCPTRCTFEV